MFLGIEFVKFGLQRFKFERRVVQLRRKTTNLRPKHPAQLALAQKFAIVLNEMTYACSAIAAL